MSEGKENNVPDEHLYAGKQVLLVPDGSRLQNHNHCQVCLVACGTLIILELASAEPGLDSCLLSTPCLHVTPSSLQFFTCKSSLAVSLSQSAATTSNTPVQCITKAVRPTQEVFGLTFALLERNPYALEAMPVHLTAALELRKKNELFLRGHRRVAWEQVP